ncbi:neuropeptide FF receptor 1-like isoform X3 [Montipora foliosa]|uniref:neuropeptide FF receptor 1-like isoform X3 n=1 Tax=Montipora foliosa TaxID=591990 RepID=UPI0035F1967F
MAINNASIEGGDNATLAIVPILTSQRSETAVWMTLAYVVIFIFGFFGNISIIYIVATRERMKSTFNFLIVNMAIGDLLVSLFLMPSGLAWNKIPRAPVAISDSLVVSQWPLLFKKTSSPTVK